MVWPQSNSNSNSDSDARLPNCRGFVATFGLLASCVVVGFMVSAQGDSPVAFRRSSSHQRLRLWLEPEESKRRALSWIDDRKIMKPGSHGTLYITGSEGRVWRRDSEASTWLLAGRGQMIAICIAGNTIYGVGIDNKVYMQFISNMSNSSDWLLAGAGDMVSVAIHDNTIYGVAINRMLYKQSLSAMTPASTWSLAGRGDQMAIAIDGSTIYAIGMGLQVWKQHISSLSPNSNWSLAAAGRVASIAIDSNTIYGVGPDENIYMQSVSSMSPSSNWSLAAMSHAVSISTSQVRSQPASTPAVALADTGETGKTDQSDANPTNVAGYVLLLVVCSLGVAMCLKAAIERHKVYKPLAAGEPSEQVAPRRQSREVELVKPLPHSQQRHKTSTLVAIGLLGLFFLVPLLSNLQHGQPYSAECNAIASGAESTPAAQPEAVYSLDLSLGPDASHECMLNGSGWPTWVFAILILGSLKVCSFESLSQILGSTDASKRPFPFGLVFRLAALWSYWGMFVATIFAMWSYKARFLDSDLVALHGRSTDVFMVPLSANGNTSNVFSNECVTFRSGAEIATFANTVFGVHSCFIFLMGAFLLGLGEVFKLEFAKRCSLEDHISLAGIRFIARALVVDKVVAAFHRLSGRVRHVKDLHHIKDELASVENMSIGVLSGSTRPFEDAARRAILTYLCPQYVEPMSCKGFTWEDVADITSEIDNPHDLKQLFEDPHAYLNAIICNNAVSTSKKLILIKLREPTGRWLKNGPLKEYGLDWIDVRPVLAEMSLLQLQNALHHMDFPPEFQTRVANNLNRKAQAEALKGKLEPMFKDGCRWEDMLSILSHESISTEMLQTAAEQPHEFLKFLQQNSATAHTVAIVRARPYLTKAPLGEKVAWEDLAEILEQTQNTKQLEAASTNLHNAQHFLEQFSKRPDVEPKWKLARLRRGIGELQEEAVKELQNLEETAVAEDVKRTSRTINGQEPQKVIWPAVLQLTATALWLSIDYVDIDPCVEYDESKAPLFMRFLYSPGVGTPFIQVLWHAYFAMSVSMAFLLLGVFFSDRLGWQRLQRGLVVTIVIILLTFSIGFNAYNGGLAVVAAVGYGLDAGCRIAAALCLSRPSQEERIAYLAHQASQLQEKVAEIVAAAPASLHADTESLSATVKKETAKLVRQEFVKNSTLWVTWLVSQAGEEANNKSSAKTLLHEIQEALKDGMHFTDNSSTLHKSASKSIASVTKVLKRHGSMPMVVVGRTSCKCHGECKHLKLSEQRAEAVARALRASGCPQKLEARGYGCKYGPSPGLEQHLDIVPMPLFELA